MHSLRTLALRPCFFPFRARSGHFIIRDVSDFIYTTHDYHLPTLRRMACQFLHVINCPAQYPQSIPAPLTMKLKSPLMKGELLFLW